MKTSKQLLGSVLALMLCLLMLLGTTFAWFTDTATTTVNSIQSGTLDVDIIDAQTNTSLNGLTLEFVDQDNNNLWEPGCTYNTKEFKVINKGNLALKYEISINGITGDTKLLEAIDWTVTVGGATTDVADLKGTLLPATATDAIVLSGHMKEEAGNEYQNLSITGIGINIYATQLNYESDSYGPDYDKDLPVPDADGDMLVEKNGIQYLYRTDSSHWLYYVTPEYAEATVNVPEGVTTIGGSSFSYNSNVKEVVFASSVRNVRTNAFKNSSVEKIVLNEGLVDLSVPDRAFSAATNLREVVFPSTLKTIGKQAFRSTAMEELTIPANVETIYEGAFRDMPNLKTVTIEGNTEIGNFAFRKCVSLETVYLKGDDVTFAGDSQVFTHADTGDATGITVYVENDTVADRLRAAQPSLQGLTIIVA